MKVLDVPIPSVMTDSAAAFEELATTAPPATPKLPLLAASTESASEAGPLSSFGDLAKRIAGIKSTEPEPVPTPRIHRRPQFSFD